MGIAENGISPIRLTVSVLNIFIGILIIIRSQQQIMGNLKSILFSLPSFIIAGLSFRLAIEQPIWDFFPSLLFISGTSFTIISFLFLGNSFSFFPALRNIKTKGPYSIIRHPGYLGEIIMVFACCITIEKWFALILFLLLIIFIRIRIHEEEKILILKESYREYTKNVTWKLIPFIW